MLVSVGFDEELALHDVTRIEDLEELADRLVEVVQDEGDRLSKVVFELLVLLLLLLLIPHEDKRLDTQLLEKRVGGEDVRHERILHLVLLKELANDSNKLEVGHFEGGHPIPSRMRSIFL